MTPIATRDPSSAHIDMGPTTSNDRHPASAATTNTGPV